MIADLIIIGLHVGCLLRNNAARPATCGAAIEVPDKASKSRPASLTGDMPAMTSTPGAVMSGLSKSPLPTKAGPNDEKLAINGASTGDVSVTLMEAVAPGVAAYA